MQKQEYVSSLVSLEKIRQSFFQSRIETMDEGLEDLVESIRKYGVLQPIGVRPLKDGDYELFAGDRRFRAAKQAGLTMIPIVVHSGLSDEDALWLQATENLQRQGLSEGEKTRIVDELARRSRLNSQQIADRLKKSHTWVCTYLSTEFKNPVKVQAGIIGREVRSALLNTTLAECEFCSVSTSEPKTWEEHKLCPIHYSQALNDPAKFKRFFGFQQQTPVMAEHVESKPLESWEDRKARMSPEHSEMEQTIMQMLLDKGVRPVLTNQKYCLLSTVPDFVFPSMNLAVYLDGKAVHNGKQPDRDDELRELLRKRHGMRVLSITYGSKSKGEVDRIFNEIVREVRKE